MSEVENTQETQRERYPQSCPPPVSGSKLVITSIMR